MGIQDPVVLRQRMLEKIMVAAFFSDGGYVLQYGDDFGVETAVDLFNPKKIEESDKLFDLTMEIKNINHII
jgi:starch synthase (maltosyl-transferring)